MPFDAKTIAGLMSGIDGPSLLIGAACGSVLFAFGLLIVYHRCQRRCLLLSLRLEQAAADTRRMNEQCEQLQLKNRELVRQNQRLERSCIELEANLRETRALAGQRQQLFEQTRQQVEENFHNLARKVLAEQGRVLQEQHAGGLEQLLTPMRNQLNEFKKRVEDVYDRESRDRLGLAKEIEHLGKLTRQIDQDALNLTRALQGKNKLQGQWGEMVLEKLLEESGLRPGRDFTTQVSLRDSDNRLKQPDVIIHLPGKRDIVVDAKMSLAGYVKACSSDRADKKHLRDHLESLRRHIKNLSTKQYQLLPGISSIDFVVLFIPVEGAFQAAVAEDADILTRAMKQRVIIAGPSTLLAILRTVHHLWQMDAQKRNAIIIAKEAGNLYDKFVGFLEAFNEIGTRLDQAGRSWRLAEKRLSTGRGNLVGRIEGLRELGIQPSRELPENQIQTR
jgi:DNA recombination protein RmuC